MWPEELICSIVYQKFQAPPHSVVTSRELSLPENEKFICLCRSLILVKHDFKIPFIQHLKTLSFQWIGKVIWKFLVVWKLSTIQCKPSKPICPTKDFLLENSGQK